MTTAVEVHAGYLSDYLKPTQILKFVTCAIETLSELTVTEIKIK